MNDTNIHAARTPFLHHGMAVILLSLLAAAPASAASGNETLYLRGSLGDEKSATASFSDEHCAQTNPPALFGCGIGVDGKSLGTAGDFGHGRLTEIALGAHLSPLWRFDLSLVRRTGFDYRGNANFHAVGLYQPVRGSAKVTTALLNLYLDLATLSGSSESTLRPYLGVSVGVSRNQLGALHFSFPENTGRHRTTITPGGKRTETAYALMLGAEMAISRQVVLDAALRFSDLGEIGSSAGDMHMNHVSRPIRIDAFKTRLRSHGLTLGMRYSFR